MKSKKIFATGIVAFFALTIGAASAISTYAQAAKEPNSSVLSQATEISSPLTPAEKRLAEQEQQNQIIETYAAYESYGSIYDKKKIDFSLMGKWYVFLKIGSMQTE